jgi:hypothetical protein
LEAVCRLLWEKFSFMLVHYNPALSEAQIILYQKIPNAQTSVKYRYHYDVHLFEAFLDVVYI